MDRNFTRIAVLLWITMCCSGQLLAQDIHYTQFYDSPLNLNPALTGHVEGKYRVNLMYRAQWPNISPSGFTYQTPSASFDINFGKATQSSSWGLGAVIVNDRTSGGLSTLEALLGAAYHFNVDGREINYISGGVQVGLIQKRIDRGGLSFGNQFDPTSGEFSSGTNVETGLTFTDVTNADLRVGATWSTYIDNFNFKLGAAYLHLLGGNEGFINESEIPPRLAVHAEAKAMIGEKIFLRPHVLYMTQAQASQLNFGTHLGYSFAENMSAYIGGGMRADDAIVAVLGFELWGAQIGLVRDFNNTLLSDVSKAVGSYEVSLSYTGSATNRAKPLLPAIRFFE